MLRLCRSRPVCPANWPETEGRTLPPAEHGLRAGIDSRTAWTREAERSRGLLRRHLDAVSAAVHRGETVSAGLAATGDYFPPLFHELVRSASRPETWTPCWRSWPITMKTNSACGGGCSAWLAWPVLELTIAIVFIGLMIWFMPDIQGLVHNKDFDALHLGLIGTRG